MLADLPAKFLVREKTERFPADLSFQPRSGQRALALGV